MYFLFIILVTRGQQAGSSACVVTACHWSPLCRVRGSKQMNTLQCARYVYQTEGIRGFYRGLTASYAGISETIICFAIYESLKKYLKEAPLASSTNGTEKNSTNFFGLMAAAALSKGCASCVAYPHGRSCLAFQHSTVAFGVCQYFQASGFKWRCRYLQVMQVAESQYSWLQLMCAGHMGGGSSAFLGSIWLWPTLRQNVSPVLWNIWCFQRNKKIWILFKIPQFKKNYMGAKLFLKKNKILSVSTLNGVLRKATLGRFIL